MSQYDNTNRGAAFLNNRKEKDTQPDFRGNLNVAGKDYWLSIWNANSPKTGDYFSVSVQPKEEQPSVQPAVNKLDDEIPF